MEKLKFEFMVKSAEDPKTNIIALTSITTMNGNVYKMPTEYQPMKFHTQLAGTEIFKKVKNTLQKRNQKRSVWITLSKALTNVYLDQVDNMCFKDYSLEEAEETNISATTGISEESLTKILEKFTGMNPQVLRQIDLKKVSEKFVIEKFTGKNANVKQWLETFEKECARFDIQEDEKIIEIFRLFLEKSCIDWYSSMLMTLTLDSTWKQWREDFCRTYADEGWTPIRYAMEFRYKTGSLLEYALKKERLLLEINRKIDKCTLIDLIAVGLPNFVTDRFDREK